MYDAIVIGARCAGASTAMLLGRLGHKVLLVDKTAVASDIPHGHFIHRFGPQRLAKWGLLDQIVETGCPLVSDVVMSMGGVPMHGKNLLVDGIPFGIGPRRAALDKILVDNAVAAGVELRDQFGGEDFLRDGDRISGIRGRDLTTGHRFEEQGQIVIGADGRNSKLAQAVNAPTYEAVPSVSCYYFSYWSGVPMAELQLHVGRDFVIFAFPTNDNLLALFVAWPIERFSEVRQNIENEFMATIEQVPMLAAQVRAGERVEKFYGTADLPNFFRKPFGPG
ncbi:MAG: FAD-dependent monooxygenase [Ardenticatenaceae bacterium]|nr:FAD-dependent monooxygenase [Ardenticatenaceae bacterium]